MEQAQHLYIEALEVTAATLGGTLATVSNYSPLLENQGQFKQGPALGGGYLRVVGIADR